MAWDIRAEQGVATVTMTTNKVNAQNDDFIDDLNRAVDRLDSEFADCSVVLTGQGRCFSAGLDFERVFPLFARGDAADVGRFFERYRNMNLRLFTYPRPTVAAINGHAFAGGLILALCCDYRVATLGTAKLSLNEVPIGIPMPSAYVEIIRHAVGTPAAARATLFGETFDVGRARELGFVHECVAEEQLLARCTAHAKAVGPAAITAYAFAKRGLLAPTLAAIEAHSVDLDRTLPELMRSEELLRAQRQRYREVKGREPNW